MIASADWRWAKTAAAAISQAVPCRPSGTGVRVRETFPDRVLDDADEVVLVDLSPEELRERLRDGKVYPLERAEVALQNFFTQENLAALRELVLREVAEDVEARRQPAALEPFSKQAVAERILALIEPQPKSQRILRRAWRSPAPCSPGTTTSPSATCTPPHANATYSHSRDARRT